MEKKKPNRRSIPVTITVEKGLLETIDSLADAQNLTRSQFIERQVRNGIEQEKTTVAMLANPELAKLVSKAFGTPEALRSFGKAMQEEVTEKHLELFNRGIRIAGEQAAEVFDSKKKGKGKKS
jgi:hypothetical protein